MWMQDVRQVFRSFAKSPGFILAVLLTLAVGIGATTAIFSVADAVLLKPIPYVDPDRLVMAYNNFLSENLDRSDASYLDIADWRKQNTVFSDLAAVAIWPSLTLADDDGTDLIRTSFISSSYFDILGAAPALGRDFTAEEDQTPLGPHVVILSDGLWRNRFEASPDILGKVLRLNGEPYTVVGVMPPSFHDIEDDVQMWAPVMMVPVVNAHALDSRSSRAMTAVARLKPGVTMAQAQAEMSTITSRLIAQYPDSNKGYGAAVFPLSEVVFQFRNVRRAVTTLLLGSGFVLLIACVNVASLFLVRATVRRREMGIRIAIGAGRRQLVRQLVTEGVLLSLIGGILGVVLAAWAVKALLATGLVTLPAYVQIGLNPRVVLLSLVLALGTGVIFGLAPALQISRKELLTSLQEGGRQQGSREGGRWRSALIVAEVALAMILLVGAGLMIRSFRQLHGTSMGFHTEKLLTLKIDLPTPKYSEQVARINVARTLEESARHLPGVQKAGIWGPGLPGQSDWYLEVTPEERPAVAPEDAKRVFRHHVNPEALSALGIPILKGRDLSSHDTLDTPLVAVVSQSMAEALWPGQDPLGKKFIGGPATPAAAHTVVGVVPDVKHRGRTLAVDIPRDYYCSYYQYPVRFLAIYLVGATDPAALTVPLRKMVRSVDPDLAIYDIDTASQRLAREESETRFTALLMTIYAGMALTLAGLGIYGVLAYAVSRRTNEIGVRMALGADRLAIYKEVIGQAMIQVLIGLVLGLAGAVALTRVMTSLLYQVSATDPATFVAVAAAFLVVALLASSLPARRAMAVDPVKALRFE